MPKIEQAGAQRRKYIRLNSVFPVQFRLETLNGERILSGWLQGFTNNIGRGGICLAVNNFEPELVKLLKEQEARLSLEIELPILKRPISALAGVVWVKEIPGAPNKYLIGLRYEEINPSQNSKIMYYAWTKKLFVPVVSTVILLLGVAFAVNSFISANLIKGNKALVEQLVKIVQESSVAKQQIKQISKEREDLNIKIQTLELRIKTVEEEKAKREYRTKVEVVEEAKKIEELNTLIKQLSTEKEALQEQLISVQSRESNVAEELLRLDKRKVSLERANFDKIYQWIKVHQNPRTGLVASFEGDKDIANWAFIYDQALVVQAYTNFSDFDRARKILDFFDKKAKRDGSQFFNAYYVNDGQPAEYIVHSGPNIWLGLAILHYTRKARDNNYLGLAELIAESMMSLQNKDGNGGIRGGPGVEWYSTEHNLDAYAFFSMLYKVTEKTQYEKAAARVLEWLVWNTYDKADIPIKRGKGDSTIATDTYAWSIAAIGPGKLEEFGMSPDRIMEFAEQNCSIEVSYTRPEGRTIKIKGFDFAPQRHVARGGVVSSEWTAQMVIAFKIMADFYYKKGMIAKARSYELKADEYLSGLANMIITSPSPSGQGEGCLPYATQEYVDTGHGWMTPSGKYTGSVSGTVYTLFAYYNFNPLELKD